MSYFVRPEILFLIPLVVGGLLFLHFRSRKSAKKRIRLLVAEKFQEKLIPLLSRKRTSVKTGLILTSTTFAILASSGPQWGSSKRSLSPKGIDLLIAVDVSKSMLAQDVPPNRLERVKHIVSNLLEQVTGDRLGLIVFSGTSFLHCPLTLDHQAFSKTLNEVKVGLIPKLGTDLAQPIDEARRSFSKDDQDKFLVLISDGEDLEGRGLMQAKEAAKEGIRIFTVGIGSAEGARIPEKINTNDFLKDRKGNEILTKLDELSLKKIAQATGGRYVALGSTGEGLSHIFSELQSIGQKKRREQLSTELPIDRFQSFILIAFLFLIFESLTTSAKIKIARGTLHSLLICITLFGGCLLPDNVQKAEKALAQGLPLEAANHYLAEIDAIKRKKGRPGPSLLLNIGLAYSRGGAYQKAEEFLNSALDQSDSPGLHSKALNALGNLHYRMANNYLDQQNVNSARKTWEQALNHYREALSLDGNQKAQTNLESLNRQIQGRIESMVCKMMGLVWRDIDGNGKKDSNEPFLKAHIFWDKDGNGEMNATLEPSIPTNEEGQFAFEWISAEYPASLHLGSVLIDNNQSKELNVLLPLYPPPPPPFDSTQARNYYVDIPSSGSQFLPMPWRAAPIIRGKVWNDTNQDGKFDANESGLATASLFLDENGNLQPDENETSFKPSPEGDFAQVVPPGQYSLCIKPDSPNGRVTWPVENNNAYLTWVNFENSPDPLLFGIFDQQAGNNSSQSEQSENKDQDDGQSGENKQSNSGDENVKELAEPTPDEVSGLYERLLQEMESKSEPLPQEIQSIKAVGTGRDY